MASESMMNMCNMNMSGWQFPEIASFQGDTPAVRSKLIHVRLKNKLNILHNSISQIILNFLVQFQVLQRTSNLMVSHHFPDANYYHLQAYPSFRHTQITFSLLNPFKSPFSDTPTQRRQQGNFPCRCPTSPVAAGQRVFLKESLKGWKLYAFDFP